MSVADTFPKLLLENAARIGDRPAIREKDLGIWQTWNWAEVRDEVERFAIGLQSLGVDEGDKVAIVGTNRPRLYWTFMAAQSLRAVPVPFYADAAPEEMAFQLNHAEIRLAVCEDQEQVDKALAARDSTESLRHIVFDDARGLRKYDEPDLLSFDAVQAMGDAIRQSDPEAGARWEQAIRQASGDDISVMLYTSGTTGQSKGVLRRAKDSVQAARDTVAFDNLGDRDVALAYLPLAWVGDHYLNYAQALVAGFCTACPESQETAPKDLREIGPTFYFAPPRVFEGLLTQVMIRMQDASRIKRELFHYFLDVAKRYGEDILDGRPVPLGGRMLYSLGALLFYGPLKNTLGFSNIRVAYTAGEAIGADLFSFFRSLGINLKQLYGQTEAFLYVTAQPDGHVRSDTVGPPMPGVDIRIADNGEVQFRSPGMFAGYFKDEEKDRETLTEDGYVKTGDAGFFDTDGQLKIVDRAKDVDKLTDGSLFAPKYIENKLKFSPNIKEAVAIGDGRDMVTCFVNIDLTSVGNWAERNNISYASYQELAGFDTVYDMIAEHIDEVNRALAAEPTMAGAQIRRFLILHKELDADDGELTRTQKVRRGFVAERYGDLIEALYDGSSEKFVSTEVVFEDGRKGEISATVQIRDMTVNPPAPTALAGAAE